MFHCSDIIYIIGRGAMVDLSGRRFSQPNCQVAHIHLRMTASNISFLYSIITLDDHVNFYHVNYEVDK